MDAEQVTILLHMDSYTVDAIFHFFNTGDTTTEWVGFPKRGMGYSGTFTGTTDFIRFQTWVGQEEVLFREERDFWSRIPIFVRGLFSNIVTDNRWLVKQVTFAGHGETVTRVRYETHYHVTEGKSALYIYGTGSHWEGNIGKATFIIDASEIGGTGKIRVNLPEASRQQVTGNTVSYELRDFEPHPNACLKVFFPVP